MSEQLLFVGTYSIPDGRFEDFAMANRAMAALVKAKEPQILSWNTYIDETGSEATTIMLHPDSESLEIHLDLARSQISANVQFLVVKRIELYGAASEKLVKQLHQVSAMSGSWPVIVKPFLHGLPDETA